MCSSIAASPGDWDGNSLVVWWLGFDPFTAVAWVQSLVRKIRSLQSASLVAWPKFFKKFGRNM